MWTNQDAASLSKYVSEHPAFIRELENRMPEIKTESTDGAAMSGARHAGAIDILRAIDDMQGEQGDVKATPFIDAEKD